MNRFFQILLFLTLFSLPSYLIRCKNFSWCVSPVPFTLLEVLIFLTFFSWLVLKYHQLGSIKEIFSNISNLIAGKYKILLGSFLLFSGISVFVSPDKIGALGIYKAYFLEPALLFVVIVDYLNLNKNVGKIVLPLLFGGAVVGIVAIIEAVFGFNPGNEAEFLSRGRVSAFFSTSNAVALLLGPLLFLGLGFFLDQYKKGKNLFLIGSSIVALVGGLLVSGSRGGLVATLCAFAVFVILVIIFEYKKDFLPIISKLITIFLSLSIIFSFIFLFNISEFRRINLEKQFIPELDQRLCLWEGTVGLLKNNPLFGAGLNGYHVLDDNYRTCNSETLQYPHNFVLNFWTEMGIFGLVSVTSLVILLLFNLAKKQSYLVLGIFAAFVAIFVHGLVDVPYFKNDLSLVFWVFLALGVYLAREKEVIPER